jgi:hypothetical protein
MTDMAKKPRKSVDDVVRSKFPGYVVSKPAPQDGPRQATPDAVVPPLESIRTKPKRGPGADSSRTAAVIARQRDTEVRLIEPKGTKADASARAMGPKTVIVSKELGRIVSRQG